MKKLLFILISILPFYVYALEDEIIDEKMLYEAELIKCENANYSFFNINGEKSFIRLIAFDRTSGELDNDIDSYVCNLLKNANKIEIEYTPLLEKDEYNRKYAYIYVDGIMLEEDLVEKGYGQVSNILGDYPYLDSLCDIQKEAILNKKGIWNYPDIKENYCNSGIDLKNIDKAKKEEKVEVKIDNSYLYSMILIYSAINILVLGYRYGKK